MASVTAAKHLPRWLGCGGWPILHVFACFSFAVACNPCRSSLRLTSSFTIIIINVQQLSSLRFISPSSRGPNSFPTATFTPVDAVSFTASTPAIPSSPIRLSRHLRCLLS